MSAVRTKQTAHPGPSGRVFAHQEDLEPVSGFGTPDRPLTRSFQALLPTAMLLMRAGFLAVGLPLDVCGFCPVLAREWHARLTHELPAYVPISAPHLDYANCAENHGEHAPEADEGRKVKMPNYEHHEHPFNSAGKDA
jgi:hypothetical protein